MPVGKAWKEPEGGGGRGLGGSGPWGITRWDWVQWGSAQGSGLCPEAAFADPIKC